MPYKDPKKNAEYKKRWREKRVAALKKRLKVLRSQPCTDCNGVFPWFIMHYDHRNRKEKVGGVAKLVSRGQTWEAISKEIEKCDLVCPNCHAIRTHENKDWEPLS